MSGWPPRFPVAFVAGYATWIPVPELQPCRETSGPRCMRSQTMQPPITGPHKRESQTARHPQASATLSSKYTYMAGSFPISGHIVQSHLAPSRRKEQFAADCTKTANPFHPAARSCIVLSKCPSLILMDLSGSRRVIRTLAPVWHQHCDHSLPCANATAANWPRSVSLLRAAAQNTPTAPRVGGLPKPYAVAKPHRTKPYRWSRPDRCAVRDQTITGQKPRLGIAPLYALSIKYHEQVRLR